MHITRYLITRLKNDEWLRFNTEIKELILRYGAENLDIERLFDLFLLLHEEARRIMTQKSKSLFTSEIFAANKARVTLYRGLRNATKAYIGFPQPEMQKAARELHILFKSYDNNILTTGNKARTSAIEHLLNELTSTNNHSTPNYSEHAERLALNKGITLLRQANEQVIELFARQIQETANRPEAGRLKELRRQITVVYTNIRHTIDGRLSTIAPAIIRDFEEKIITGQDISKLSPDETFLLFAREFNVHIAYFKALVHLRITQSK